MSYLTAGSFEWRKELFSANGRHSDRSTASFSKWGPYYFAWHCLCDRLDYYNKRIIFRSRALAIAVLSRFGSLPDACLWLVGRA